MDRPEGSDGGCTVTQHPVSWDNSLACACQCRQKYNRTFTILNAVSCIACITCVFITMYVTHNNKNIVCMHRSIEPTRQEQVISVTVDDSDMQKFSDNSPASEGAYNRYIRATPERKDKGMKKRNRTCKCRGKKGKRGRKGKDGISGVRGEIGPKGDIGPIGQQGPGGDQGPQGIKGGPGTSLMSAHYRSNFEEKERPKFLGGARCISTFRGQVCRNRTIILPKSGENYRFLHPESWVNESIGPLKQNTHGVFTVQHSGIYMIYSTTDYYDAKSMLCQVIKINGNTKFRCLDGVDAVSHKEAKYNMRHKTCSLTGVAKLSVGDKIQIQNVFPDVIIDISKDRTYFGVVLLHSFND